MKKRSYDKRPGLADLLKYASMIDEGILLCKDGTHIGGFYYRGKDIESSTWSERNAVAERINNALKDLGNGWMIHCDAIRVEATGYPDISRSFFPDSTTRMIEEERIEQFAHKDHYFETIYALLISYLPPLKVEGKVIHLMYETDKERTIQPGERILELFKDQLNKLAHDLKSVVQIEPMQSIQLEDEQGNIYRQDMLLSYINRCISGIAQPILLPKVPIYLDCILGAQEFYTGTIPKIGEKYLQCIAIEGFPSESYQGILDILNKLPLEYRWNTRYIFLEQYTAENEINKYRRKWKQKIRGIKDQIFNLNGPVDQDALAMYEEANAAIADSRRGNASFGYYTSVIIVMDENYETLKEYAEIVRAHIRDLGFTARIETVNTIEAWLGSLPGHSKENVRRPLLSSLNLADLLPTSSLWAGSEQCPCNLYPPDSIPLMHCTSDGSTPFRLNLHVGDVGHTLVFGPTGAGKSTHLGMIAAQFKRYLHSNVHIFDKGMSAYALCKAVGGKHFAIASEEQALAFCPLSHIKSSQDIGWFESWLEICFNLQNVTCSPEQKTELHRATITTLQSGGHTLTDLATNIQDKQLRAAFEPYTLQGAQGHLLDAEKDGLTLSKFTVYEIEELMELGDQYSIPVLLYIFWRIEKSLDGNPSLIILDEAWIALGHAVFRNKIREWLKVLRKANCAVILATQNIGDAFNSGIIQELDQACPTKIFLPNHAAKHEKISELYFALGLNTQQINIISQAIPKHQYYYTSTQGNRLYSLALGPKALAFVAKADKDSVKRIKALEKKHKEEWVKHWLEENGIQHTESCI